MKPGKPLRRTAMRQGPRLSSSERKERQATREFVFERDGYACQLAVRLRAHPEMPAHTCQPPLTPQHIVKASQGGPYTAENLVAVCWLGNSVWIEQHRREAAILGLHRDARRLG